MSGGATWFGGRQGSERAARRRGLAFADNDFHCLMAIVARGIQDRGHGTAMSWPHKLFMGQVSDFELRLLRVFQVVVEREGFTAAEAELGITRSTISKHISDLEIRLGARLCDRGRSGFELTDEGRVVYEAGAQLLSAAAQFRLRINEFHQELTGELHIGLIDTLVTMEETGLRRAVARYTDRHPNVRLTTMVGSAAEIDRAVQDRRLHIGVTVDGDIGAGIVGIPLGTEVSYIYCGRDHDAFDLPDEKISLEDISRFPFVLHGYSEAEAQAVERWNLSVSSISHQTEGILLLVLSGMYVGFIPDHFARRWEEKGEIRRLLPDTIQNSTGIVAITHKNAQASPIVQQFLSFLPSEQTAA